ncbi:hypothetical protein M201_gp48 [Haloarcula californiae tailed virus 2]|uniref:Uncharacterized protein n=1 Tax=Haloarcula californiae tailed virus 2 TaxID=1273747 RepID=R4TNL2_9CAUD|nr:hypothetical protein M201_gp48 [Haloarcula californiae tailed virus 2]AGM11818.1 hypothetical protein HCTV2_47 [Haloarcula californiae tailed virus 2]
MAQQTDTEWTQAQNANDLEAGDDVRLRNEANGSVELEGTVRSSLGDVGTVQVRVGGVRTSEVYAEGDGEWTKRGTCWTYTLEVRREVATDGGVPADVQAEREMVAEQEAQAVAADSEDSEQDEGEDEVAVAYETARRGELKVETGRVLEDSPYQHRTPQDDEVYVEVERDGSSVYLRVPVHGGNVYALHHATKRHDTRQGSLVGMVDTSEVGHKICMNCREMYDSFACVNTGHATTGDTGCPDCLEAEGLRNVVHEVGDDQTVKGGHISPQHRDHGSSVTLEAAKAITEQ